MTNPAKALNAWLYLNEDEPSGTNYTSTNSCYQTLITYGVYNAVNMLGICFFTTTGPANNLTLAIGSGTHPGGYTNAQYLQWITRDARATNPNIKLLATLDYGTNWFAPLFSGPQSGWQSQVNTFASNLLAYLQANNLDGFDIDWEWPLCNDITQQQFAMLFQAIRAAFNTSTGKYFYLTTAPATTVNLDAPTVNQCFDIVTLQLYYSKALRQEFINYNIDVALLAYGAKFESTGNGDITPYQDAQNAYAGYKKDSYGVAMQWRLNSGDYQFEQAQQMLLAQLIWAPVSSSFDDSPIVGAAGNPPITQLVVRSGNVLDAIQATNTGKFENPSTTPPVVKLTYSLEQHGGNGGAASTVATTVDDPIVQISGYTGTWFGWNVVLQITLTTKSGKTFGPFGTMANATSKTPFNFTAPSGQSIVAFKGTTVVVPEASAPPSAVIASLGFTTA
jgi:hypothetical protein